MFLPIRDDNPHTSTPFVNYGLIIACAAAFLWQLMLGEGGNAAIASFGLIPARLFGAAQLPPHLDMIPAWATVFSSMFLHGGWMHFLGNMGYLWIFGDNVEASLGHKRYLVFYLLCGVAAALSQSLAAPGSQVPMIGASGAIAGVLGAYLVLHPRSNIKVLIFFGIITIINVPAFIVLGFWFGGQLLSSAAADPGAPGVAFLAHIGGFVAGAVLVFFFKKRNVRVFESAHSKPFAVDRRPIRAVARGSVPDSGRRGPWS
jgi:membrane associated rhomboid family serine protease